MPDCPPPTTCGRTVFKWGERTYIMGIVNMSPDSFSGDGIGNNVETALAQARQMVAEGADIIDVGGESTRPGTQPHADIQDELRLVIPFIEKLSGEIPVPISIDTYKSGVASAALAAGASMINDIWGLKKDPKIAGLAAKAGVPVILMSNQRDKPCEGDIMAEVVLDLASSIDIALKAGIKRDNIIIDPGIGFGKKVEQNLEIIRRLNELAILGKPILLATSRKSTIGMVLDLPAEDRLEGTAATIAIGILNGAHMVRVHDVKEMARVARMTDAILGRPVWQRPI